MCAVHWCETERVLRGLFAAEGEVLTGGCSEWLDGELRRLGYIKVVLLK